MKAWMMVAVLVLVSACTNMTKEAKDAAEAAKRAQYETREAWKKLLTYSPPPKPPLAQRRYCYKQQSDIVCYDAEQNTTSPLIAIQEGNPGRLIAGKVEYENDKFGAPPTYISENAAPNDHVISAPVGPAGGEVVTFGVQPPASVQQQNLAPHQVGLDGKCLPNSPFPCKESGFVPNADVGK